jgi:hypothetical protein
MPSLKNVRCIFFEIWMIPMHKTITFYPGGFKKADFQKGSIDNLVCVFG